MVEEISSSPIHQTATEPEILIEKVEDEPIEAIPESKSIEAPTTSESKIDPI